MDEGACPWARCRTTKSSSVHLAALIGQTDILTELVRAGADLGVRDDNGVQAAHLAVWAGHIHILRIIFDIQPQLINSPIMPPEIESFQDELDSWDHDHQSIVQMVIESLLIGLFLSAHFLNQVIIIFRCLCLNWAVRLSTLLVS